MRPAELPCSVSRVTSRATSLGCVFAVGLAMPMAMGDRTWRREGKSAIRYSLPRRELFYRLDRQRVAGAIDPSLADALASAPPILRWEVTSFDGRATYRPFASPSPMVRKRVQVDLAIFGSELESIATAIAAAKRGFRVALVTDTSLGGLCSDTGGNLRYIDGIPGTRRTGAQLELYQAMGVRGYVAIPAGVEARIASYLAARYADQIEVVRTRDLGELKIGLKTSGAISAVTTDSGVRIEARRYLDTDPECRVGERSGLAMSPKTPALAYGLMFDIEGLRPPDYAALRRHDLIQPEALIRLAGANPRALSKGTLKSRERLTAALSGDFFRVFSNSSFGYRGLAEGFDFFMRCREARQPDAGLHWLNACRTMSGFNVSHLGSEANVNGIGYRFDENVLQHAHSLHGEARWRPIVEAEAQGLNDYFRYVTGNPSVWVRLPDQFYVRRATAYFPTSFPYTAADFARRVSTRWWMTYPMDFRGLHRRPGYDDDLMSDLASVRGQGNWRWDCRPSSCTTAIPNLFLLNKCSVTPKFSGGLRIVQNLVNTGQAWVEALPPKTVANLRR